MSDTLDKLFLVKPGFADPAYPGTTFYCWHCALLEGVLTSFPDLARRLAVERVDWPRPRTTLVEQVGPENQSVPLLLLAAGVRSERETGQHKGRGLIADKDAILAELSERHGFPVAHP